MKYVLIAAALLAGCTQGTPTATTAIKLPYDQAAFVRSEIASTMKDPESAKFRNERAYKTNNFTIICGEVNAKNSYGAYTGYSPYYVRLSGKTAIKVFSDSLASIGCHEAASGQINI